MNMNKQSPKTPSVVESEKSCRLDSDDDCRKRQQDELYKAIAEFAAQCELPLVQALQAVGEPVKSVSEYLHMDRQYPKAIPILIEHLKRPYMYGMREMIARALTVRYAGAEAYKVLVDEFIREPVSEDIPQLPLDNPMLAEFYRKYAVVDQQSFKWALGNAISIVAGKKHFDEIVRFIRDKRHGDARGPMVLRLPALFKEVADREKAIDVLIEALEEEGLVWSAAGALARLKAQRARPYLERCLKRKWTSGRIDSEVRKQIERALKKIK